MGDPKKPKKKYRRPLMIWNEELLAEHGNFLKDYGLKNKKEVWRISSALKSIHDQAKKLTASKTEQSKKEAAQLIKKLSKYSLVSEKSKLEDVLSLAAKDLFDRRLQTIVVKRGLAKTMKQARQFITHNHISIGDQTINSPSYLVKSSEENIVTFNPRSSFANEMHPERIIKEEAKPKKRAKKTAKEPEEKIEKDEEITLDVLPEEKSPPKEK